MVKRFLLNSNKKVKRKGLMLSTIALVTILMVGILVSCTTLEDNQYSPPQQENTDDQTGTPVIDPSPTIKTDSGSYVGQADNNSIEIRISGIQDDKFAFRVFKISDEVRTTFESLLLKKDDIVKFEYYEQSNGQPVLTGIEKISN